MSIIYEALKKVEESQDSSVTSTVAQNKVRNPKIKAYLVYCLIVVAGFFVAKIIFEILIIKNQPQLSPKQTLAKKEQDVKETAAPLKNIAPAPVIPITSPEVPLAQEQPQPTFVLNGLFFSQNKGYVLINNQILKEGDTIAGAIVKRITLEAVELEQAGSIIKLLNKK